MVLKRIFMLTPIEFFKGAKNKHPTVLCKCDCGENRLVRTSIFRRGLAIMCIKCLRLLAVKKSVETKIKKMTNEERGLNQKYGIYKINARKRNIDFLITKEEFKEIILNDCDYCGDKNSCGIDRVENDLGYILENCVSCCSKCNYAKRNLSKDVFLKLVEDIYAYQNTKK
jgi:hypothetical protein